MRFPSSSGAATLAFLFALLLLALACAEQPGETATTSPSALASSLPVEALQLEMQTSYAVAERYAGRIVPRRESALGFERSARLALIHVDQGDRVEEGDLLAVLETEGLLAREKQLVAQVEQSRARLSLAHLTTGRKSKLARANTVSTQELDEAQYQEQAVAAELAGAEAALAQIRVDLGRSALHAPFSGSITGRFVDEGTVVVPGQQVVELIEDDVLEVEIGVPPELASQLEPGSRHVVEADGVVLEATLHAVVSKLRAGTRTVPIVLRIAGRQHGVRSGALARITLEREVEVAGAWLPMTALAESHRGLWSAYVLVADTGSSTLLRVDRRQVEVLHAEADRVFVRGTLREGETVAATGLHRLVPGLLVRRVIAPLVEPLAEAPAELATAG